MLTGVVLARNEELNIVECLSSLRPHVTELILIDMASSDRTVELARPFLDRLLKHPLIPNFDAARNVAIDEAQFDWQWFVDADERISPQLGAMVWHFLEQEGEQWEAVSIPFKSYFCGQWMQHCGWWPGYTMPRILKRGFFRFSERLHGGVDLSGREARFPPDPDLSVEHFSYRSIEHYIEKFNRYTSVEAAQLNAAGQTWDWRVAASHFVRDLWIYYEHNPGHRDGTRGWILSWLSGMYRWLSHAKLIDLPGGNPNLQPCQAAPATLQEVFQLLETEVSLLRTKSPKFPLGVVWRAPIWDYSGYADEARTTVAALARSTRTVLLEDIHWSSAECPLPPHVRALLKTLMQVRRPESTVSVTHTIPVFAKPDPLAAYNVLRTTFETDRIPAYWHESLAGFDEIWVFNEFNKQTFRRAGVAPERLRVVPCCIDTDVYCPEGGQLALPPELNGRFVFLSVFDWGYRKGWDVLLRAYCEEFSVKDGVGLLLKITRSLQYPLGLILQKADELLKTYGLSMRDRCDIVVTDHIFDAFLMPSLYRSANAFVLPSRGEGWGRPYMEAMACGLPTIGSRASGNLAYMNDSNSLLITGSEIEVQAEAVAETPIYAGHKWFEPDISDLRTKMRRLAQDAPLCRHLSKQAVLQIHNNFNLSSGVQHYEEAVSSVERCLLPSPLAPFDDEQICVELEGELFAGHSFSNINETLVRRIGRDPRIFLTFRRRFHSPVYDEEVPRSREVLRFVDRKQVRGPDVTIRHAYPPNWKRPTYGKWVQIQPWEFGHLPREWVPFLRDEVDEIWCPSSYVSQVYANSGITTDKLVVIPWGTDTEVYSPDSPPLHLATKKSFRFAYVGGTIHRKGFDRLLAAYLAEFTPNDDVCLVVKDVGADTFYRTDTLRQAVLDAIADGRSPSIIYLDQRFTPGQLASLYTATNVLVAPYRGEGFCLPALEAMSCGLVPIVPRGGATDDFVDDDVGLRVECMSIEQPLNDVLSGPAIELDVPQTLLQSHLRWCLNHRDVIKKMGQAAAQRVRERFTWSHTIRAMSERIEKLTGRTASAPFLPVEERNAKYGAQISTIVAVRNDEKVIGDCLARLTREVGAATVVDIGGEDRSLHIALEYGCHVIRRRGLGVEQPTLKLIGNGDTDWVLMMDGHESWEAEDMGRLRKRLKQLSADIDCLALPTIYVDLDNNERRLQMEPRLFRVSKMKDFHWCRHRFAAELASNGCRFELCCDGEAHFQVRATLDVTSDAKPTEAWLAPFIPRKGDVFIDVGANVGQWTKAIASRFNEVHALEPHPEAFCQLTEMLPANVIPYNLGAWHEKSVVRFSGYAESVHTSAHFAEQGINTGPKLETLMLPCCRLDDLTPSGKVDFVKCDVEGAEIECLRGGEKLICSHRPLLLIEVHGIEIFIGLSSLLTSWKYAYRLIRDPAYQPFSQHWFRHFWLVCSPFCDTSPLNSS